MIKSIFLRVISVAMVLFVLPFAGRSKAEPYDVKDPEKCALDFYVLSDSHIEGNNFTRYTVFARALRDVKKNRSGSDAVVFLGDNTMNGFSGEHMLFHGTAAILLRDETVLPVLGNHDIGNGQGDYPQLQQRWYDYTRAFFGRDLQTPYYSEVIEGCRFIVLGTEGHTSNNIQVSEAQLQWLEDELAEAAESGRPAFVFLHHPVSTAIYETGARASRLGNILTSYNREHDVFVFVGHTHRPLSLDRSFRNYGFPETYLPCLTKLYGEKDNEPHEDTGIGLEVEVYRDEVVLRGRDLYRGEWYRDADREELCEVTYTLERSEW